MSPQERGLTHGVFSGEHILNTRSMIMVGLAILAGMAWVGEAAAQKSLDTVRIAVNFPIKRLSPYSQPDIEAGMFFPLLEEPLIHYDEREGKFIPALAIGGDGE
jgi:hypothetical protein